MLQFNSFSLISRRIVQRSKGTSSVEIGGVGGLLHKQFVSLFIALAFKDSFFNILIFFKRQYSFPPFTQSALVLGVFRREILCQAVGCVPHEMGCTHAV